MAQLLTGTRIYGTGTVDTQLFVNGTNAATSTTTGALQVVGGVGIGGKLYVGDTINGNLAGGSTGAIVYQSNSNITAFLSIGSNGQILQSNGSAPVWIPLSGVSAGSATTATHLSGGVAGQIPYQTAPGVTAFLSTGTAGDVLVSNGSSASTYNNTLTLRGTTAATSTATGALVVAGGVGIGQSLFVQESIVQVGGTYSTLATTYNLINTTATTVNFAGAATSLNVGATSGSTNVRNNLTVSGNLTVQGTTTIVDSTVTNIADPIITLGGGTGNTAPTADDNKDRGVAFKWVNNSGTTSTGFFGYDDSTGYFTYVQTATITNEVVSGTKGAMDVNLAGGTAMSIHYQSAADTTAFLAAGSSGFLLQTNGTGSAPTWVSASGVSAGSATNADNIRTVAQTASATYYPTFVDSNNASNAYELVYTTGTIVLNPSYGSVGIGADPSINSYGSATTSIKLNLQHTPPQNTTVDDVLRLSSKFISASNTASAAIGSGPAIVFAGGIGDNQSRDRARIAAVYEGGNVSGLAFHTQSNADTLAERVRIQNNGNVGIGTISPAYRLETVAGDSGTGQMALANFRTGSSVAGYNAGLQIYATGSATATNRAVNVIWDADGANAAGADYFYINKLGNSGQVDLVQQSAAAMTFQTAGTERLRITANGGISFGAGGTAYGTSGQVLQSNGDAAPTWINQSGIAAGSAPLTNTYVGYGSASNLLTGSANLTWNGTTLYVNGRLQNAGGLKTYSIQTTGQGAVNAVYEIMKVSRDAVNWSTNTSYEITVRSSYYASGGYTKWLLSYGYGDVGTLVCTYAGGGSGMLRVYLGSEVSVNANCQYKPVFVDLPPYMMCTVEVRYNTTEVASVGAINSSGQVFFSNIMTASGGTGAFYNGNTHLAPNGGNVGIGTLTPAAKLAVVGTLGVGEAGSTGARLQITSTSAGAEIFQSDNSPIIFKTQTGTQEKMRIADSGNIGIGVPSPEFLVDLGTLSEEYTTDKIRFNSYNGPAGGVSGYGGTGGSGTSLGSGIIWKPNYGGYSKRSAGILQIGEGNYFRAGLAFYTNNVTDNTTDWSEVMRIGSNGNVAIGAGSNPSLLNKFEVAGTAGQLFSVSDSFTGTIFSVNDVSGIPSIEVLDTGLVKMAQYNGQLAIGTGTVASSTVTVSIYGMVQTMGTLGEIRASSEITAYFSSDRRLKENIKLIENPITIIDQIRGVTFDWTDEHMARRGGEDGYFVRKHDIGVIAQEVQAVLPELVGTREDGYLAVKYEKMVPLLIEAIKAQQKTIDSLVKDLDGVKEFINNFKNGI